MKEVIGLSFITGMTNYLIDPFNRTIDYLRVSITDLCNFRCVYCRPPEGVQLIPHENILRYEEIMKIVDVAAEIGIRKIRVTGGEPLVRRGVVDFIRKLTSTDSIEDVGLTTNGALLGMMAPDLKGAGLKRINVSLDSLRRDVFKSITGSDMLDTVLESIDKALECGFDHVKINVVLLKDVNELDVPEFARITLNKPVDVRFIERMPFGREHAPANSPDPFSALKALEMIRIHVGELIPDDRSPLDGPASMFHLDGAQGRIGVIDPVTGHFCGDCNRLRLTAKGALRPCLLSSREIDLRSILRSGANRETIASVIRNAVNSKPVGRAQNLSTLSVGMNSIGG